MSDILEKEYGHENTSTVTMSLIDLDTECYNDMLLKRGFYITEKGIKKKKKTENGIYSSKYATDWDDDFSFEERYSCECKHLKGKTYEGEICPNCRTKVSFTDVNMSITGWIKLDTEYYIHPTIYKKIESLVGADNLTDILTSARDITFKSNVKKESPFSRIGLDEFRERYLEILDYYYKKKKAKTELYLELYRCKNITFQHNFPVFSSVIRPANISAGMYKYVPINKTFSVLVDTSVKINNLLELQSRQRKKKQRESTKKKKKTIPLDREVLMRRFQEKVNKCWDEIFSMLDGKKGHIKDNILGGRIHFTARNVIIPDPTLKADEVRICYRTMLELYKFEIIAYLVEIHDITSSEAFVLWTNAVASFDESIYELCKFIVKQNKPKLLINRPPTINFGSILIMKVVDVKKPTDGDYTLSLPIQILQEMNADFDGDNLTIISLKIGSITKEFDKVFNPRKGFFISRNDGLFNNSFNLYKDQIIGLYTFNTI